MLIRLALGTTDFDAYSEFIVHSGLPFFIQFQVHTMGGKFNLIVVLSCSFIVLMIRVDYHDFVYNIS